MDPLWVSRGSCCHCQAPLKRGAIPFSWSWETSSKSVQPLPLSEASEKCNQERNALVGWAGLGWHLWGLKGQVGGPLAPAQAQEGSG